MVENDIKIASLKLISNNRATEAVKVDRYIEILQNYLWLISLLS